MPGKVIAEITMKEVGIDVLLMPGNRFVVLLSLLPALLMAEFIQSQSPSFTFKRLSLDNLLSPYYSWFYVSIYAKKNAS